MADTSTLANWNNNPGNLRPPKGVTYDGQIGVDDRGFAIFENKDFGRKALVGDVQAKLKNGLNTPASFIDRYAPEGDNDEAARDNYKIHLAETLGLKSTGEPFPEDSHERIANAIASFEGASAPEEAAPDTLPLPVDRASEIVPSVASITPTRSNKEMGVVGGGIGLTTGIGLKAAEKGLSAINTVYDAASRLAKGQPVAAAQLPAVADALTGRTPGEKWGAKTGYGKGPGSVQEASSRYQRTIGKGPVSGKMDKLWGPPQPGESPQLAQRLIDKASAAEALTAAQAAEEAAPLSRISKALGKAAPYVSGALKIAGSGLGGATAAVQGYNAIEDYKKHGFTPENVTQGISATGGALGMVPYLPFQAAGLLLQTPEAILNAYRYLEKHPQRATSSPVYPDDPGINWGY